ncbi:hypothetical protein ACFXTI_029518 [Malus domestica]
MITGLVKWGELELARYLFDQMSEPTLWLCFGEWLLKILLYPLELHLWPYFQLFRRYLSKGRILVSWTSIIYGFTTHRMEKEVVKNFASVDKVVLKPNLVTFFSIFNACSHGGLMDKGLNFFRKMIDKYEMALDIKHYSCLIDMLMRAGRLKVAEKNGFGDSVQYC